jgi:hypothetical protein
MARLEVLKAGSASCKAVNLVGGLLCGEGGHHGIVCALDRVSERLACRWRPHRGHVVGRVDRVEDDDEVARHSPAAPLAIK